MSLAIRCRSIITPEETVSPGLLVIGDDGRIVDAGAVLAVPNGATVLDLPWATLVPGFIDLHVHGGGGFSLATLDPEEVRAYARWVVSHGVTSFLPTICAGGMDEGIEFVQTAARTTGPVAGGANVLGVNLEGPFVNPVRRGALPKGWVQPAEVQTLDRLVEATGGNLRLMTLAPELPGGMEVLGEAVGRGIVVSIGHTDADYETALAAFEAGASHVTHAFNAMRPFHHRQPGPVFAAAGVDGVTIEIIADGVHLHDATARALVRAASPGRIALVTDGVPPAGLAEGAFVLGEQEARMDGGAIRLPDGTIAGSAKTMDEVVRRIAALVNAGAAATMASTAPARVLGLAERKGRIAPGYDADIVALSSDLQVVMTWVGGDVAYRGESEDART